MKVVKEWLKGSQTVLSMFLVQVFATGMQILSRVILVEGTFIFALIAYRHVVAARPSKEVEVVDLVLALP
ncbi:WAT1-related protein [Vigna unguiculata]|uniref:WAT1-related protein n=1 Tax=Vigna unguiculata TaxID=3917 RepID=A0A4D6NQ20_VIGUN|nr:WAT1-related protein [Vigna unguiculata]